MIEGHHTLMGTYEAMNKRIYDALPTDHECRSQPDHDDGSVGDLP